SRSLLDCLIHFPIHVNLFSISTYSLSKTCFTEDYLSVQRFLQVLMTVLNTR
ncbi:hypothetical protein L9F63_012549, partial [Diploptera punctata]